MTVSGLVRCDNFIRGSRYTRVDRNDSRYVFVYTCNVCGHMNERAPSVVIGKGRLPLPPGGSFLCDGKRRSNASS